MNQTSYLSIYPSIHLSISLPISHYLPIYLSIDLSIYLSISLPISHYLPIYESIYLWIYLSIYLSTYRLCMCLSVCMYVSMYVRTYVRVYVCLYIYIYNMFSILICNQIRRSLAPPHWRKTETETQPAEFAKKTGHCTPNPMASLLKHFYGKSYSNGILWPYPQNI